MGANPRTKGQSGEREVADMLNFIIYQSMKEMEFPEDQCLKAMSSVQRNQNQSAVGGNDLTNCLGLSIEVKRQETLSVPAWWRQCCEAAERNGEKPVLMYRQNRKAWRVVTQGWVNLPDGSHMLATVEFDIDTFKTWFRMWALKKLHDGAEVRT
jgi:hypothetical protein